MSMVPSNSLQPTCPLGLLFNIVDVMASWQNDMAPFASSTASTSLIKIVTRPNLVNLSMELVKMKSSQCNFETL